MLPGSPGIPGTEGTQLADAIGSVATGGTALDPAIVEALVRPVVATGGLNQAEERLLGLVALRAAGRRSPLPVTVTADGIGRDGLDVEPAI